VHVCGDGAVAIESAERKTIAKEKRMPRTSEPAHGEVKDCEWDRREWQGRIIATCVVSRESNQHKHKTAKLRFEAQYLWLYRFCALRMTRQPLNCTFENR